MNEPILILFALIMGMWASGERSLRKSMKENYDRACKDAEYWRGFAFKKIGDAKQKQVSARRPKK